MEGGGWPAMLLRPLVRAPYRFLTLCGRTSMGAKPVNLLHTEKKITHKLCNLSRAGGDQQLMSFGQGYVDMVIGGLLKLQSPCVPRCLRQDGTSNAFSALEVRTFDLPRKAPLQPRKRSTKLKTKAKVEIQHISPSQVSVPRAGTWSDVKLWVVFSDLHFSRLTRDICLQVLEAVHAEAAMRKAGIIFLGDFWHARGALPVELLNDVIMQLSKWTCPAVFIPGNHDQVNMGGQVHALMVLGAVNPLIKVFDDPVEFLDALWIPFRRDHNLIKQTLQQHPNVKAIFAHLDVVGAFINEASQAKEGIEPSIFPQNIPVFTGHYHKPHVVKDTQIEYIGSPYQVSASETGQAKRFLLLNSLWKKVGEIPIDIGGRHFVMTDREELSSENVQNLRSGDRLRLLLSTAVMEDTKKADVERLQTRGVQVNLVFPILTSKPRILDAENLDAFGLFNLYAERVQMSTGAKNKGAEMLLNMNLPAKLIQRPQVHLVLQHVEIQGFGPYLDPVHYPLAQRGVRVVCGRNMDSVGADSNGAGKSTLVMAPLWALSGSTDPRPESMRGLSTSDVIHEKAKTAHVHVKGTVNGRSFTVERSAGRKLSLKFYVDGEDWTCQDTKLTQAKIDELIDTSMLQRVAFHGQYGIGGLLEASDKDFKDELSRVIYMDLWIEAKKKSLQDLRSKQTEVDSLEGALTQVQHQKDQIARKVEESENRLQEWEESRNLRYVQITQETNAAVEDLAVLLTKCSSEFKKVQEMVQELEGWVHKVELVLVSEMKTWHGSESSNQSAELDKLRRESLMTKAAELSAEVRNAEVIVKQRTKKVNNYRMNVSGLEVCDNCLQPIDSHHFSETLALLEEELTVSEEVHNVVLNDEKMTIRELQQITEAISEQARRHQVDLRERTERSVELRENVT